MDHIRIAIRDSTDSMNICFLDNKAGIKFHETTLQRFLKGTCNFLTLKFYGKDIDTIYPGCRLAFKYGGNDYWLTINSFKKNGYECSLTAYSLSLETNKEKRKAFKAPKWTFKQYLDYVDPEHSLTLGLNEVASQSMKLEWSGTDTILARLFSIANSFGAELEFVTELNDDYSLKRHVLNVYKIGNIGKDKTGMPIRVGKSLKVINYTANIDELYTAIRVHGKDGLTIAGLDKKVYDKDNNLLYYTQGDTLYAPQSRDRFPAIAHKASDSFICLEGEDTEHSSKESLYAYMLGELKKHSEPKIDYETEGYVDGEIGDRMLLIDGVHYDPPLYVEARISEQTISLLDKSKNKTVFTNYERKESEIANELLAKMNALIEENKVYDVQIMTSNGYSFKNGFGETTLTARVMDGAKDVTSEFSLTWFKNSTEYAHTASINVQAGSIDELATYLIIAEKDGRERGRNELTVFNVKDGSPGKTPVVHLAWADSSDGSVGFSLELPTDKIPKYRGYYVDYSTVASTNPKLYKWDRNPDDAAKVADEAKDKADSANSKADSAISTANTAKDTADEASKQTALVNELANTAKELADKANADAAEANRLIGLANGEIDRLNTDVSTAKSDLANAEADLNSKIETVKTTLTQNYATKTNLSDTQITLNKTISESVASVKQEMSETYAVKTDLTTLQGEYNSFKEDTAKKFSQQVSSISTIQTNTTEAQKLANDAYSKAQNAVASATNASSTANSALDKAADATSVANSASQNASNAVASANSAVSTANTAKSNADKAIADVAALTKTVSTQSTRIDQTSSRIDQVASGVTEIGGKLDNLSIGGRNLLHGTVDFVDVGSNYNSGRLIETVFSLTGEKYKGLAVRGKTNISGMYTASSYSFSNFNLGDTYTFSFYAKGSIDTFSCYFYGESGYVKAKAIDTNIGRMPDTYGDGIVLYRVGSGSSKELLDSKIFKRYYVTWKLDNTGDISVVKKILIRTDNATSGDLYICGEKMETGNKNTDHSPSPEDDQSQIDGINNNLSNNYYQKTVVDSKISTAVSGITAQYTKDISTKLNNYYDKATMDRKLTIDGLGIETYVKDTKSQLDNLQVGGRNYLIGTNKEYRAFNLGQWSAILNTRNLSDLNLKVGDYITASCDLKVPSNAIKGGRIRLQFFNTDADRPNYYGSICNIGEEKRLEVTVRIDSNLLQYKRIDLIIESTNTSITAVESGIQTRHEKLEIGNMVTDWSPAPEDMATLTQYTEVKQLADRISSTIYDSTSGLVTKTNQLAGKYAIQNLNSSGDVLSSLNLNGGNVRIKGGLIDLDGNVRIQDAFINNLVANSIVTNKIKSTEISGDIIKGGTIQGVTLKSTGSGAEPGEVEINDGTIAMEKQEVGTTGRFFNRGFVSPLEMTMAKVGPIGGKIGLIRATSFTPSGFNNQALDTGNNVQTHRLYFHYQGLSIESDGANSGVGRNSGLKVFGDNAYIDLKSGILNDPGNDSDPIKMRIIATPNNTFEFRNNYGNIYMFTKNNENIVVNGYKIPYTFTDNNMGIRVARIANPTSSGAYLELSNMVGKAWGVSMWASDQRLKSDITTPTQDALAAINQLQVRQFDWRADGKHEDFGLIAQEVEQVLPNAVFKVGDYYQIKDSGLIPVLIGAVQKLSNKVNLLENIIYNTKGSNLL